MTDEVSTETVQ